MAGVVWPLALLPLVIGPLLAADPDPKPPPNSPSKPLPDFVLDCYVVQSSSIDLGQFVRHLRVLPGRGVVSISDGVRGQAPRFIGDGRLVTLTDAKLVYDFASYASAGRTEIDRKTGAFRYRDGRSVISGSCQKGGI